jgi:hypothetical protein
MNFPSASPPIAYANVQMSGHPGTPGIIPSPQDANGDINFNNIMKNVPGGMQVNIYEFMNSYSDVTNFCSNKSI